MKLGVLKVRLAKLHKLGAPVEEVRALTEMLNSIQRSLLVLDLAVRELEMSQRTQTFQRVTKRTLKWYGSAPKGVFDESEEAERNAPGGSE